MFGIRGGIPPSRVGGILRHSVTPPFSKEDKFPLQYGITCLSEPLCERFCGTGHFVPQGEAIFSSSVFCYAKSTSSRGGWFPGLYGITYSSAPLCEMFLWGGMFHPEGRSDFFLLRLLLRKIHLLKRRMVRGGKWNYPPFDYRSG
jgi:hypothetical protein